MALSETSRATREVDAETLRALDDARRGANVIVPVDDDQVRSLLRNMGEPITLFGEGKAERRDRLRALLVGLSDDQREAVTGQLAREAALLEEKKRMQRTTFYTEGDATVLPQIRAHIARVSLERAARRVHRQRQIAEDDETWAVWERRVEARQTVVAAVEQEGAVTADERPISGCAFHPGGAVLAAGSWGGKLKILDTQSLTVQKTIIAHDHRITDVASAPGDVVSGGGGGGGDEKEDVNMEMEMDDLGRNGKASDYIHSSTSTSALVDEALGSTRATYLTGCADGTAALWAGNGTRLHTLTGHTDRLARVAWHPHGSLVGTASYDRTWRLWDVERGTCLVEQEGHSSGVYTVAFHPDGSLAISGGLDAACRVWDLRTGRSVLTLEGHAKGVLTVATSPNGFHVATGSDDHSVRVWDLRRKAILATLPGHTSLVSVVKYDPSLGDVLLSGGYDGTVKIWSAAADYGLLRSVAVSEGKIMCADVQPGNVGEEGEILFATGGYDRTVRVWKKGLVARDA